MTRLSKFNTKKANQESSIVRCVDVSINHLHKEGSVFDLPTNKRLTLISNLIYFLHNIFKNKSIGVCVQKLELIPTCCQEEYYPFCPLIRGRSREAEACKPPSCYVFYGISLAVI